MNGRWHRLRCLYLTDNHAGHHSIPHTSVSVTSFCTALTRKEVIMTNRSRYHGHTAQPQSTISSKIVAVFALMLVIAFAVALAKYLQTSENQTTNVTFASSERISDNSLRVWVDVKRKNVDTPAYCIVTALNYDMAEVGRREVYISPGGENLKRLQLDIITREPAVAGGAYGCGETIPFYLDQTEEQVGALPATSG